MLVSEWNLPFLDELDRVLHIQARFSFRLHVRRAHPRRKRVHQRLSGHASALLESCDPAFAISFPYQSVPPDEGPAHVANGATWQALRECTSSKSNGCAALEECREQRHSACSTQCEGSVVTRCDDTTVVTQDCGLTGLVCVQVSATSAACGPVPNRCVPATFVPRCEDDRPVYCAEFPEFAVHIAGSKCSRFGLRCEATGELEKNGSRFAYRGTGPACPTSTISSQVRLDRPVSCEGASIRTCVNGRMATIDCEAIVPGSSCQTKDGAAFCGEAAERNLFAEPTCEGTSVVLCRSGRIEKVDCRSLGFEKCNAGACRPD